MADIFVSYSRQNEEFGRKLHSRLTGLKRDVWMDWEDIPFSSDWWQEIKQGIETSDNFLIILTSDFVNSPVCMLEVEYARRNNKRILIIAHDFHEHGSDSSLLKERTQQSDTVRQILGNRDIITISQENWRSIGHVNWLFFNDDSTFEEDFRNLIDTLDTDLEHVRTHTTLQVRALDWFENDKNWSFLLTGVQIDHAEEWLETAISEAKSPRPTELHSEFIKASRQQQDEQEQNILEMQTRAKRFRQASIVAGVIAAITIIAGIGLSVWTGSRVQEQLALADTQIGEANEQVRVADEQIGTANAQAEQAGETLTSIPPTFEAIQDEIDVNNTQVASVGETLTPIGATLEFAESAREAARILADDAQTQVVDANVALNDANASLTPVAVTLTRSAEQQALADAQVATANSDSMTAQADLENASTQVADAAQQIGNANAALNKANATLSPIAPTLTQASNQIADANSASTQSAEQLATASIQIAEVSTDVAVGVIQVENANAVLTQIVPTLTQAGDQVIGANTQVASAGTQVADAEVQVADANVALNEANATLSPIAPTLTQASNQIADANSASTQSAEQLATASIQIADVSTDVAVGIIQVENANAVLTQIVPTLTRAGDQVIGANTQVASAGTRVAIVDDEIATAGVQNQNLQGTAAAIEVIAEDNRIQAQSQALIVNAEQAAVNGDIDLALALLLESYEINPDLPQTRRLLNDIAYTSARFILPDTPFVTFSSDSSMVAYGDGNEIVILNLDSHSEVVRLEGHTASVVAGDFNFEDTRFVSGSRDSNVIVWNTATWEIERTLSTLDVPVTDVSFDNQGNRIGVVGEKSTLIVWEIVNGYNEVVIDFANPDTILTHFYFYGDGSRVLAFGQEGQNEVQYRVNLSTRQFARDLDRIYTTVNPAYDVNAGHTSRKAMVETESFLTIYEIVTQAQIPFVTGFNWIQGEDSAGVRAFDSTGSRVVFALSNERESSNELLLITDTERQRARALEFEGEAARRVTALAFSPDGRTILSGFGRYLVLWDVQTGRELRRFGTHRDDIVEITYSLDSNHAITRSRDGNYRVWDVSFADPAVIGQVSIASSVAEVATSPGLSPDGSVIYFNRASEVFRVNASTGVLSQTAFSYFGLQDVIYSRINNYVVTTSANTPTGDSLAMMWDASLPANRAQLWNNDIGGGDGETIDPIGAFSADGEQLALSMSQFLRVYDLNTLFEPGISFRFNRTGMDIGAMVFSPDSRYLYLAVNQIEGEEIYALVRLDLRDEGNVPEIIPIPHIRPITSMDINDEGTQIITGSADQTVVLFDLDAKTILRRMVGHSARINEIYFGLDDRVALSASDDGSLILWDLDTGQSIRRYVTGTPVSGLYLSNDSRMAVSTEGTNFVTIWQIETLEDVVTWVRANRDIPPLTTEECRQFEVDCPDEG